MIEESDGRGLFRKTGGGLDLQRMLENAIPIAVMAGLGVWANSIVVQTKVETLATRQDQIERKVDQAAEKWGLQSEKQIALNAQIAVFIAQQTQLNTAMDARMTYLERDRARR